MLDMRARKFKGIAAADLREKTKQRHRIRTAAYRRQHAAAGDNSAGP